MNVSLLGSWRTGALLFTGAAFLFACAAGPASTKKKRTPQEPGDDFYDDETGQEEQPIEPTSNADSGAFGAGARPASGPKDGGPRVEGGSTDGGTLPKVYCAGALKPGDLAVVELMITSRAGSGDDGEWVEIRSTRDCWLELKGLVIESPRGALPANTVTVAEAFELPPGGTFIVADSADPAKNNGVAAGGKVFSWEATDVLKNDGDTIVLKMGAGAAAAVIETLTYPAFSNLEPGRSLAFPADCANYPGAARSDWARWSLTFDEWRPGKKGTPNATNDDVACY